MGGVGGVERRGQRVGSGGRGRGDGEGGSW